MALNKKEDRQIAMFTFTAMGDDPENWYIRAKAFKNAAVLIAKSDENSTPFPYYYNSAIALELILKATAIAKSKKYKKNHCLNDLCELIGLKISHDQESTLELLSAIIVWSGRYPVPNKEGQWDNYYDVVHEKHVVRERDGNVGRILPNKERFPTLQNFQVLWELCEKEYESSLETKHD